MVRSKRHFLHTVEMRLRNLLANFQPPSQTLLSQWFTALVQTMRDTQLAGCITNSAWISTPDGLQRIDWPQDGIGEFGERPAPLYLTTSVHLPYVTHRGKSFQPTISQTTFAHGIFPQTVPEVETTILDLSLQTIKGKGESITVKFTKRYDHHAQKESYELRSIKDRELALAQCTFIKALFDKAATKMRKPTH